MSAQTIDEVLDLERCEGLLIVHSDGRRECSEHEACPADLALHAAAVDCLDVVEGCCAR